MKNVPDTKLGRMYRAHIQLILDKNIDALLDQYTDDALLISSFSGEPQSLQGPRRPTRAQLQGILGIDGLETDIAFWAETDDPPTLMIVEAITMTGPDGDAQMRFADSWVLREGRIAIHFAGMTQYPDGSVA